MTRDELVEKALWHLRRAEDATEQFHLNSATLHSKMAETYAILASTIPSNEVTGYSK